LPNIGKKIKNIGIGLKKIISGRSLDRTS